MNRFNADLQNSLTALREGDLALARDYSETILKADKHNPGALRILSQIEYLEGNLDVSIRNMEQSLEQKPDQYSLWIKLGNARSESGDNKQAETAYSQAMAHSPSPFLALFWRAQARLLLGEQKGAFKDLEKAIELNSLFGQAYRLIAKLDNPKVLDEAFIKTLEEKVTARLFQREDMIHAHYALAAVYEKKDHMDEMWNHLKTANNLQKNSAADWQASYGQIIDRSKEIFTNEFIAATTPLNPKTVPVFIVGHPRSGSTLLEKMLAAHPEIASAGETDLMPRLIGNIQNETLLPFPNGLEFMEAVSFQELGKFYAQGLEKLAQGKKFTTDKLLSNIFFVGLIKKLMPEAKIIYLKRDPLDTAFSIYKNYFWEGQTPEYSSLEWIGKYFRMTEGLMDYWQSLENIDVFEVVYEKVVNNPEAELKPLLEYIGVPWNAACLDHRQSKTLSNTISVTQVNEPLSTASIGSAANFGEQMAPFIDAYQAKEAK